MSDPVNKTNDDGDVPSSSVPAPDSAPASNSPKHDSMINTTPSRDDGFFESTYKDVMRFLQKIARKTSVERLVMYVLVIGLVYSLALSFMPLAMVRFFYGNGLLENRIQQSAVIRGVSDVVIGFCDRHIPWLLTFFEVLFWLIFLIPLIFLSIALNPKAVRSVIMVVAPPFAITALVWRALKDTFLVNRSKKQKLKVAPNVESRALFLISGTMAIALTVVSFGLNFVAPGLFKWLLGDLSVMRYFVAMACTIVFGTAMAILHLEGTREKDGAPINDPKTVHAISIIITSLSAVTVLLLIFPMNRRVAARMMLLADGR